GREEPPPGGALGRGEGPAAPLGALALGRPAAAALHRAGAKRRPRSAPHGRTGERARSDRLREDRGAHPRAARAAHDHHRYAQHAAGGPCLGFDCVLLHGRTDRARFDGADLHQSAGSSDRGLRHRKVRLGAKMAVKKHTDRAYDAELDDLRSKLLTLGGKVEAEIAQSMRALSERDSKLAEQVVGSDREVNRLELEVDESCRRLLALRQPAASDLRFITTALKIDVDLERIGDLAVNIAERAIDLNQSPPLRPVHDLTRLAQLCQAQLRKALDAFV